MSRFCTAFYDCLIRTVGPGVRWLFQCDEWVRFIVCEGTFGLSIIMCYIRDFECDVCAVRILVFLSTELSILLLYHPPCVHRPIFIFLRDLLLPSSCLLHT